MTAKVFLGIPTYNGDVSEGTVRGINTAGKSLANYTIQGGSVLPRVFNRLLCQALNGRASYGYTHFAMMHADITPVTNTWLDLMVMLSENRGADILSVVSPLKDDRGLTSTAVDDVDLWRVRRLTMREIQQMPTTFTESKLLVNTGLMLIDIRKEWAENSWFTFDERIIRDENGFHEVGMSEDWLFSRRARNMGATIWATREVILVHSGRGHWTNQGGWGQLETDTID